jgi:hypothetical protein
MSNPEVHSESPTRTFQSITGNGPTSSTVTRTHTNGSRIHRTHTGGSRIHRTSTNVSHKESKDPDLDINLPYRTFSDGANLEEYTSEKPEGEIEGPFEPDGQHRYKLVTFFPNDPENPKNFSTAYKWWCTMVVALTCFVVAFCSAVITSGTVGPEKEFHISQEVSLLPITVFVVGFGIGIYFPATASFANTFQALWLLHLCQKSWADG